MRRVVLLAAAAGYWLALLATVVAVSAVGQASRLRHPLYTLFVAAAVVLACAVMRWPPRRESRRPSSIPLARPPRPRPAEPPRPPPRGLALTETTLIIPGAVKRAAWEAAQAQAEAGPSVAVAEPDGEMGGLGLYLSGHAAGAHPEGDDGQRPDVEHLRGFADGAVDHGRSEDDTETD